MVLYGKIGCFSTCCKGCLSLLHINQRQNMKCTESKSTKDSDHVSLILMIVIVQACRVLNSTSCDCPTPDLSDTDVESETAPPLGTCEFEMMYHNFQDNTEVKSSALTKRNCRIYEKVLNLFLKVVYVDIFRMEQNIIFRFRSCLQETI